MTTRCHDEVASKELSKKDDRPLTVGADRTAEREALAARLQWDVRDPELLLRALSHRSWCAESAGALSNERLEFLGDAVLGLIVTDHLFLTYPSLPEGELAKVRASVVNSAVLAEVAADLRVGDAVLLGKGESQSGGREKPSILADAMEALIGAVYLDGGWDAASDLVMRLLAERMTEAAAGPGGQDFKTRLQELCARRLDELPHYQVIDEGPDHAKVFDAVVLVAGVIRGHGHGRSKKQAEQAAARIAWQALTEELGAQGAGGQGIVAEPAAGSVVGGGEPGEGIVAVGSVAGGGEPAQGIVVGPAGEGADGAGVMAPAAAVVETGDLTPAVPEAPGQGA